ncbi:allatostatin C-like [Argiope bruennichi]|uniref:allatostatin C-like n=1 Tax=Argiope bruennichi TaxID=94029 RepID=UPI0024955DE0|nr:allatostatin C-like [Argiope bruennichi]
MKPTMKLSLVWMFAIMSIGWALSDMLDQEDKNMMPSQFEISPDENTMRNALMYYLLSRQGFYGMRTRQSDSQRKRSSAYSKQCAFNAVSCFGKK